MEIKLGSVVRSRAGRDKGGLFIVLAADGEYAYIADGELRRAERPKKKKLKHLQGTYEVSELIASKLNAAETVTSSEVRKALAQSGGNDNG